MWIPRSAAELRAGLADAKETASIDFKRELPAPGKNEDLAIDIAAMATDGGVIIVGVDEDKATGTFVPRPILLGGAAERLTSVVRSSVGNPPSFEVHRLDDGVNNGFLVVVVPASPLAPHMVQTKGQMRFYGRGPGGNVLLTQADVDRLYERRRRWEEARSALLDAAIEASPLHPNDAPRVGCLYVVTRPTAGDSSLGRSVLPNGVRDLPALLTDAVRSVPFAKTWDPPLSNLTRGSPRETSDGVALDLVVESPTFNMSVEICDDGTVRFTYGGVATERGTPWSDDAFLVREAALSQLTAQLLVLTHAICSRPVFRTGLE